NVIWSGMAHQRRHLAAGAMLAAVLVVCGCGAGSAAPSNELPIRLLATDGPGNLPVLAATSMAQLEAQLCVTGCVPAGCLHIPTRPASCWPDVPPPASALLIAFNAPGGIHPAVKARLDGVKLTVTVSS